MGCPDPCWNLWTWPCWRCLWSWSWRCLWSWSWRCLWSWSWLWSRSWRCLWSWSRRRRCRRTCHCCPSGCHLFQFFPSCCHHCPCCPSCRLCSCCPSCRLCSCCPSCHCHCPRCPTCWLQCPPSGPLCSPGLCPEARLHPHHQPRDQPCPSCWSCPCPPWSCCCPRCCRCPSRCRSCCCLNTFRRQSRTQTGQQHFHLESEKTNQQQMSLQSSNFHSIVQVCCFLL